MLLLGRSGTCDGLGERRYALSKCSENWQAGPIPTATAHCRHPQ